MLGTLFGSVDEVMKGRKETGSLQPLEIQGQENKCTQGCVYHAIPSQHNADARDELHTVGTADSIDESGMTDDRWI